MRTFKYLTAALFATACSVAFTACGDDGTFTEQAVEAQITVVTSISGPGDNGYNDQILAGVMEVANSRDVEVSLVHPTTMDEAKSVIDTWKQTAAAEPKLLVLAGSDYEDLARTDGTGLDGNHTVLLFESYGENMPQGVKTFRISRYGVGYLAGCMAKGSGKATIVMAMKDNSTITDAANGFADGYNAHSNGGELDINYLSETVSGYAMPDSAYHLASDIETGFVFPLAGGSNSGIYKYTREAALSEMLVAGMDVDCAAYSKRVPFSVIIDIKDAASRYLNDWIDGKELADKATFTLADGMADIQMSDTFYNTLDIWEDYYEDENYWQNLYDEYKDEARKKEEEHEG